MHDVATLDVREVLKRGGEPLPDILEFVQSVPEGEAWRLIATFEPIPLLRLMETRGFGSRATMLPGGDWEVVFSPGTARQQKAPAAKGDSVPQGPPHPPATSLDNSGLLPPEPMVRVLEALNTLADNDVLEVLNDRLPVFLLPELAERGYAVASEDLEDGGVRLLIWRDSPR